MAGKHDGLLYALGNARLTGSYKTVYNHRKEASRFVETLRALGFGIEKWEKLTGRHVAPVVTAWQQAGLSVGTIKNYLAGVRAVCTAYGNKGISGENADFGLGRRNLTTNVNRAVPDQTFHLVVEHLRSAAPMACGRIALMLSYQREFGMRFEESCKFNPFRDVISERLIRIHVGTKGGRPRYLEVTNDRQRAVIHQAFESKFYNGPRGGIIPRGMREEHWRGKVYRDVRSVSLATTGDGLRMHGLRHTYAQERYRDVAGFWPPCRYPSREDFMQAATLAAGPTWRQSDELARCAVREELGHSPGRIDIDRHYLGR